MKFSPVAVALFLTGTSAWFCIDAASVSRPIKQGQEKGLQKGEVKSKHGEGGGFVTESFDRIETAKFTDELKVEQSSSEPHLAENHQNEGRILHDMFKQIGGDIDAEAVGDQFGWSMSMSNDGNRVAIGTVYDGCEGEDTPSGYVRVYELKSKIWTQIGGDIGGEAAGDASGYSVSMSKDGNRVAIGAQGNNGSGVDSGHVRVHEFKNSIWTQIGDDIDGEAAGDLSGFSVSISNDGNRVAVGAIFNGDNDNGYVRVYELQSKIWTQIGDDIDGEIVGGEVSGASVSMSNDGNRVAVGDPGNDGRGSDSGHVRVYDLIFDAWTQIGGDIDGEASDDYFGASVSMSNDGNRLAIGAPGDGVNDSGYVRVYELQSKIWTQIGGDIAGEAAGDASGYSVSMSNDGNRVAIGAFGNVDSDSGYVRVYLLKSKMWIQIGGGEAAGDLSGLSASISNGGNRLAIGAPPFDGSNGYTKVYDVTIDNGDADNVSAAWNVTIDNGDADNVSAAWMPIVAGVYFLLGGVAFAFMM